MNLKQIFVISAAVTALAFSACEAPQTGTNNAASNADDNTNTAASANSSQPAGSKAGAAHNRTDVYAPEKNSPERKAILDALRQPVSKELKQEVSFIAEKFKVRGDWAFISGKTRNAQGGPLNWKITKYQERIDSGDFEDNLFALLKKNNDEWSVVTYLMSCQDVCYLEWDKEYKAPKAILE